MLKYICGKSKNMFRTLNIGGEFHRILSLKPLHTSSGKEEIHLSTVEGDKIYIVSYYEVKIKPPCEKGKLLPYALKPKWAKSEPITITLRVITYLSDAHQNEIKNKITVVGSSKISVTDIVKEVSVQLNKELKLNGREINPHFNERLTATTTIDVEGIGEDVSVSL